MTKEDIKSFFEHDLSFELDKVSTLVTAIVSTSAFMITLVIPFLNKHLPSYIPLTIFLGIEVFIIGYWLIIRNIYPKGKEGKQNIIIAICTEDGKQKSRIANDLKQNIDNQLKKYNLHNQYNTLILNNSLSKDLKRRIEEYASSKQNKTQLNFDIKDVVPKRLKSNFFVYGSLIKRNQGNSTYLINIDALLLHAKPTEVTSKTLQHEFSELWQREVSFLESDEINGFRNNANQIFFAATYMLGLATLVNNRFEDGIKIWLQLEKYVKNEKHLEEYAGKIIHLKHLSLYMLSRLYHIQGYQEKAIRTRAEYLKILPNEYDHLISESVKHATVSKNYEMALSLSDKAGKLRPNDCTWKYNRLYLLIALNEESPALAQLDDILAKEFTNEGDIIQQVIGFNESQLKNNPYHIQTKFIVGCLIFKKLNKPVEAYEHLADFEAISSSEKRFPLLVLRSQEYLNEINSILGIEGEK